MDEQEHSRVQKMIARGTILSGFAGIVGLFVGGLGVYFGWQALESTRTYASANIRPLLDFEYTLDAKANSFIAVMNVGVGPAVIRRFSINSRFGSVDTAQDREFTEADQNEKTALVRRSLGLHELQTALPAPHYNLRWLGNGSSLQHGETLRIFEHSAADGPNGNHKSEVNLHFMDLKDSFNLEVEYCDIIQEYCTVATL